jgi:sugar lactone lactonase YvrE
VVWRVHEGDSEADVLELAMPGASSSIPIAVALDDDALLVGDAAAGAILRSTHDGVTAVATGLKGLRGIAAGPDGVIYVTSKFGNRVLAVDPAGDTRTVAGTGRAGFAGDGGAASSALLSGPTGIAVGTEGTVFVSDTGNNRVRAIDSEGTIVTIAGTGVPGLFGDGGSAAKAELSAPLGLFFVGDTLYVADTGNDRIRAIRPDLGIETVAP